MATNVVNMIYLGQLAVVDTVESDTDIENGNAILGSYSAYLDLELVAVTNSDPNSDGAIRDDEMGESDTMSYTTSNGSYTGPPDASFQAFVTITEKDMTVHNIEVLVVQAPNGDTFLSDLMNGGTLDNLNIQTIEITAISAHDFGGYFSNQAVTGTTVCFVHGARVSTPAGPRRVEALRPGDLVDTLDHGPQPLRWIAHQPSDRAPVLITRNALAPGVPGRDLRLSDQHRVLLRSAVAERMFGTPEVFVPAIALVGLPGIDHDIWRGQTIYTHLGFDRHEVLFADGAPSESFLPGRTARASLPAAARRAYRAAVPDWQAMTLARPAPTGAKLRSLIRRLSRNHRVLVDPLPAPAAAPRVG